jgi:hypothetical protein
MAAVDPKQLLVDNKVLFAVYLAALVPIPLWFVLVAGGVKGDPAKGSGSFDDAKNELTSAKRLADSMAAKIGSTDPDNQLYTEKDIERLQARRELYEKEVLALRTLVTGADVELEKWLDVESTRNLAAGQNPKNQEFASDWTKEIIKLHETYKKSWKDDKGVEHWERDVATSDTGEDFIYGGGTGEAPAGGQEKVSQKRYWVQLALLEALSSANLKAKDPHLAAKLAGRIDFVAQAAVAPEEPYEPIKVRVLIKAPFTRIPVVIRELLAQKILIRVTTVRVDSQAPFIIEHAQPKLLVNGGEGYFLQTAYFARVDAAGSSSIKTEELRDDARWIWEPPVVVELGLEVYDFRKLETPKPAEGEGEGEGEGDKPADKKDH